VKEKLQKKKYIQLFTSSDLILTLSGMLASSESIGRSLLDLACQDKFSEPVRFSQYRGRGLTKELLPAKAKIRLEN